MHMMLKLAAAIALSAVMATSLAGARSTHTTVNDFSWREDGRALALHSQSGGHVVVTRAEPAPFHGLRVGDVILAVDGVPLQQVEALMRTLRTRTSPISLRVRRGNSETTLVWSRADYRMLVPPPPAAPPPPPPAPPAPPSPI
jgi:S1-C subfamily serine protease